MQRRLRRPVPKADKHAIYDHVTRFVRPDDALIFAGMEQGQIYADVAPDLRRYRADIFDDKYKRLDWSGLSRSITAHLAKDGYWYIHPDQDRTLSIREAARIQTFPDTFRFAGHPTAQMRQIGNAVPPLLAEAVAGAIARHLQDPASYTAIAPIVRPLRNDLLEWQEKASRSFPWRSTSDPWLLLIAETCLRRTKADQVEPVYRRLVELAPTPRHLLRNRDEALREMLALGLRWRAENLFEIAARLCDNHDGEVPRDMDKLRELPGVGDYVASAISCFAFGNRAVLIDANTRRIGTRITGQELSSRWALRLALYKLSGSDGPDRSWNYALLDLGGLVCRPKDPACGRCPIQVHCSTGGSAGSEMGRDRA